MKNIISAQIIAIFVFFTPAIALEADYDIHEEWTMLTCAGFGYHLEFDNYDGTFRLRYGDECTSIIRRVYKGKFRIDKQAVILDFGKIKVHYYLKLPYTEPCGGESLSKRELNLICDESKVLKGEDVLPTGSSQKKQYLEKPTLFPLKIEANGKGHIIEELIKDLNSHCFIIMD